MPFLLLFLLTLTCLQPEWPAPPDWLGATGCIAVTWAGVLLFWLWAALWTHGNRRRLLDDPMHRGHWMRRFAAGRGNHFFALLGFFLVALFLGWGWIVKAHEETSRPLPGLELLLLTPLVMGLVGSWALFYPMERAAHDVSLYPDNEQFLSRWAYVGLQARHNLLLVVPPLALLCAKEVFFHFFPDLEQAGESVMLLSVGLLAAAFICMPLVLRIFLGLRSMPPSPLRSRLEATGRRLHFRFADILLWNTRGTVANAMVTGVVPWVRYVVVTDRLCETLTEEEIEGVFGHEVGHIKHHHIFFYLLFIFASLIALGGLIHLADAAFDREAVKEWIAGATPSLLEFVRNLKYYVLLPILGLFAFYIFIVFGYLSRRCERQADIYGSRTTTLDAFISALEKVALINGIPRDRPGWLWSWQHGTIGQRVAFLEKMKGDTTVEKDFQRNLSFLKWGVVLLMAGFSLAVLIGISARGGVEGVWKFIGQL
jgi:STE24 endopeptidase